ncbi:MAG: glycosyltransferase family 9 protein [Bdellovibrionales bacterium]|nr:glycosyltransferase family 9 protein [Bdellovibrionales bacterium]
MKAKNKENLAPAHPTLAILQMTRFGDLIQTTQAVQHLKKSHPQYRIILIARSQFTKPLGFLLNKYFDQVYSIDTQSIFADHQVAGLKKGITGINSFLGELKSENISALINLSFSKSSSYLSSIIPAQHKIGSFFDFNNKLQINDKWSQVLFSTVMRGALNPYSLVDLFRNIIGIKSSEVSAPVAATDIATRENVIVMHPFASSERKAWKPEKWVEVIYKTLKDNDKVTIALVGAKNETLKSQLITENPLLRPYSNRLLNVTGKTSIEELSRLIGNAKLFVGHDSMVGHLAAINSTPTLTISLGNVRPHETTPYQVNAYNIAPRTKCFPCFPSDPCAYTQCHHDIPYQLVSNVIKQLLSGKEINTEWIKNDNSSFHLSSVNFYRSRFQNGQFMLDTLIDDHQDVADIFRTFYRIAWSFVINSQEENLPFPKLTANSHRDLLDALTGLQHLFELSEFGQKYSRYILEEISSTTPSIMKIKEFSKKIDEIDHLQAMVQKSSPYLAPLIDYFTVRKGNLFGENIVKLTESSYYCFEENAHLSSVMYELIQNTIAEYKINSTKPKIKSDLNK